MRVNRIFCVLFSSFGCSSSSSTACVRVCLCIPGWSKLMQNANTGESTNKNITTAYNNFAHYKPAKRKPARARKSTAHEHIFLRLHMFSKAKRLHIASQLFFLAPVYHIYTYARTVICIMTAEKASAQKWKQKKNTFPSSRTLTLFLLLDERIFFLITPLSLECFPIYFISMCTKA